MNDEEARQSLPATNQNVRAEGINARGERHLTPLQSVFGEVVDALALIEKLRGRERAVAFEITRRRLRRMLRRNRAVLEEWELWPEDEASISLEWTVGRARLRVRGSDAQLAKLRAWLVGNEAAFEDLHACVTRVRREQ